MTAIGTRHYRARPVHSGRRVIGSILMGLFAALILSIAYLAASDGADHHARH